MLSQLADFVSLIYPRVCYNCNESLTSKEEHLCLACELDLPKSQTLSQQNQLLSKFSFVPKVSQAFAYLDYNKGGISQNLIQGVKYRGKKALGEWLGHKFGSYISENMDLDVDVLIPVPIHIKRRRKRGYNQSEIFAQGMSSVLDVDIDAKSVVRTKHTKTQTTKSKTGRWETMEAIFRVTDSNAIQAKKIMLFDDVITTGATMGILCEEIAKHDPKTIIVCSLAAGK